jgi:hypothetical protein
LKNEFKKHYVQFYTDAILQTLMGKAVDKCIHVAKGRAKRE